jgi:hypothetical protein
MYTYEYDSTRVGDFTYRRSDVLLLHEATTLLAEKLEHWDDVALRHGATEGPYAREVADLRHMIGWWEERLAENTSSVFSPGLSVASVRYQKAALIHASWAQDQKVDSVAASTWPTAVAESIRVKARRFASAADSMTVEPAGVLDELRAEYGMQIAQALDGESWDAFVSHAHEDKKSFAEPLATALRQSGLRVWYDEFSLSVGDSLRRSIDRGLARSKFGVVILSKPFFAKEWPQKELDGLVARESDGHKVILPVWHEINANEVARFSPTLADRVGVPSKLGVDTVVRLLREAMGHTDAPTAKPESAPVSTKASTIAKSLSDEAKTLIAAVASDGNGMLFLLTSLAAPIIQVSGQNLIPDESPRSIASWLAAVEELAGAMLIQSSGATGQIYTITKLGFSVADALAAADG